MSKGFEHARRYWGKRHQKDRYDIMLKLVLMDPIRGKWDGCVEVYDRTKKPGKQILNRFGLSREFFDIAMKWDCMTYKHFGNVHYLDYDPDKDRHHEK